MTALAELGGWPSVLAPLLARRDLSFEQARAAFAEVLAGDASPAQLAGFVVALRTKGETIEELSGLLAAMLDAAVIVEVDTALRDRLVDTCGTGGDRSHSINVSTLAAFVVAGAGVPVYKHGNRAASSACGSADLLEALGVAIELDGAGTLHCLAEAGMAFCFAQRFHPALRHAGPTRRELGVPTAFNVLGPLANPARVRRQVVGVGDPTLMDRMLGVLVANGALAAMVVHGDGGLDELALSGPSRILAFDGERTTSFTVEPSELGLMTAPHESVRGGGPSTNAGYARRVLDGEAGPHRDIVVLNAAAGLLVGGVVTTLAEGGDLARAVLDDGRAAGVLDRLIVASKAASA